MVENGLDWCSVFQQLNLRQKRCAALLISGVLTNTAIAKCLGTTRNTVANVISAIMDVCGVDSRLNLVLFIIRTPGLEQKLLEFEQQQRGLHLPELLAAALLGPQADLAARLRFGSARDPAAAHRSGMRDRT